MFSALMFSACLPCHHALCLCSLPHNPMFWDCVLCPNVLGLFSMFSVPWAHVLRVCSLLPCSLLCACVLCPCSIWNLRGWQSLVIVPENHVGDIQPNLTTMSLVKSNDRVIVVTVTPYDIYCWQFKRACVCLCLCACARAQVIACKHSGEQTCI